MKIIKEKTVYISHLHYTVELVDINKVRFDSKLMLEDFEYFTQKVNPCKSVIYARLPVKNKDLSTLGHEIVHCLQNICHTYEIKFELEKEHMGYLFQYIFNELTGFHYIKRK